MSNIVSITTGQTMTSRELADLTEKRHDNVKRTIEILVNQGVISRPQFEDGEKSANGVVEKLYRVGKRDSYVIVAQLSPEFTARLVDRWQALEAERAAPVITLPGTYIEALEHLLASKKSEQLALADRDHAIATKAEIGSRREASAMATASAAVREVAKLKSLMGEAAESASILAVQSKTGIESFDWKELKGYCTARGLAMKKAFNPRLQLNVNTYPAEAWSEVYGIDIQELFATRKAA